MFTLSHNCLLFKVGKSVGVHQLYYVSSNYKIHFLINVGWAYWDSGGGRVGYIAQVSFTSSSLILTHGVVRISNVTTPKMS